MKKRLLGVILVLTTTLTMSLTVVAAAPSYNTQIDKSRTKATGSTSYGPANFCSAETTAKYVGGSLTEYATGISGASATVKVSYTTPITSAETYHVVEAGTARFTEITSAA